MAKTYIENIKLTAIRNKLFSSLIEKEYIDIFTVLTLSSGDFLPTQKMINGQYSVFGGGGITDKTHNEFNIQNETIGIGRVGARCGCVFKIPEESWVTDNALYANKIDANFDLEFLIHYLNFKNLLQFANTSAQPVISLKRISSIMIPSLSLKEQKEIVKILNDIENGIIEFENDKYAIKGTFNFIYLKEDLDIELTHQLDLIKQLRQAFLREAMQGRFEFPQQPLTEALEGNGLQTGQQLLTKIKAEKAQLIADKKLKKEKELAPISEDEIPFEIPNHWAWCRLGEMSINCDGARKPISQTERQNKDKIYDYYGASGIIDKIDGYTHDGKFLLIGEDGANLIAKSTPIAFIAEGKFWVNNHAHVLDFIDDITKIFMTYCLNTIDIKPFISGGFQPKLNQANLNLMQIPLPPLHEQEQIVSKLEELMKFCDSLEQSIKESQGYNEMLLQQVLRVALQGEVMTV